MARRPSSTPEDPEDEDDLDAEDDEPSRTRRARPPPRRTARRRGRPAPVKEWRASGDGEPEPADDELPDDPDAPKPRRAPVYWRARDSLFFEPLVALAIIVVLIVSLFAYTQNWPPVYVVESDSMQHGSNDMVGLINTGDLVLAQRLSTDQITPYELGRQTGYSTYGEYGDVLLYHPNGQGATPIIHRSILEVFYNASTGTYSLPVLTGQSCGSWASGAVYDTPGCATTHLLDETLTLYRVGWRSANLSIDLSVSTLGPQTGFLTAGDNNFVPGSCPSACAIDPDQPGISTLVEPSWVIGVARGMVPWFGAFKLLITNAPTLGEVPSQSWQYMGITLAAVILGAIGLHYLFRAEGIETELRKREEEAAADVDDDTLEEGRARRWFSSLRPWRHPDAEDPEPDDPPPRKRSPPPEPKSTHRHGRPRPRVRREPKKTAARDRDDDDSL